MTEKECIWLENILNLTVQVQTMGIEERERAFLQVNEQYESFNKEEKNVVKAFIRNTLGDEYALTTYSFLVTYADGQEIWDEIINIITTAVFDPYVGAMLELQVHYSARLNSKYYSALREMHRKNARRFQDILKLDMPYRALGNRNKKRICIITEQLLILNHAPTKWCLDFSYAIQHYLNYESIIISLPSNLTTGIPYFENGKFMHSSEKFEGEISIEYRNIMVNIRQISMSYRDAEGYRKLMYDIAEWNPLFVFQVGAFNPIAELPALFTSLVSMKLATGCPVSDAGILVRLNHGTDEEERLYEAAMLKDQMQFLYEKKAPIFIQDSEKRIRRSDLGLPDGKFLMAIVGNRLDQEVDAPFLDIMKRVVSQEPRAALVFIGENVPEKLPNEPRLGGHVYRIGYQEDLMAAYSCMDLYVNPKRQGGGGKCRDGAYGGRARGYSSKMRC